MRNTIAALLVAGLAAAGCVDAFVSIASAETDAQWKPSVFNKIIKCRPLWIALGDVPTDRNAATRDTTFVCHVRFAVSHDNVTKTPDWVLEKITRKQISGNNSRPSKGFTSDKRVPPRGRAVDTDYPPKKVGFARGHMAPSEDFNSSSAAMKETFVLSNAVPQIAPFNGGVWGQLEDRVRDAAFARDGLHVITGPVRRQNGDASVTLSAAQSGCNHAIELKGPPQALVCKANNKDSAKKCSGGVAVPIAIFKIAYDSRTDEIFAFLLPNRVHNNTGDDMQAYLDRFRVSVSAIEGLTGLQFFRELPQDRQSRLLKSCDASSKFWAPERPKKTAKKAKKAKKKKKPS
jgi:endonuclease G